MKKSEEKQSLRKQPVETITIQIPSDTLTTLRQLASVLGLSEQELLNQFIHQGINQKWARISAILGIDFGGKAD